MNKIQNRRDFLGKIGMSGAAVIAAGAVGAEPLFGNDNSKIYAAIPAQKPNKRANECAQLRRAAAQENLRLTPQNLEHPSNNDENLYPDKIGSYTKGLPHNSDGTVVASAYNAFLLALSSGQQTYFDTIPLGGDRRLSSGRLSRIGEHPSTSKQFPARVRNSIRRLTTAARFRHRMV